ncbi:SapC family protein [Vreelandella neptunia]|uniref:SapC family protein n=1 Tax=Vreelandella neptunia TaxID=115551 RepID=A0ABZ0YRQ3_9GAMM|nr:SapC family protein [Halomonas neptunia]MDN3559159.1 SapC family protein [Halomonas neptunia]WQH14119.1 SapC family protein [Halomonas neptunia]
MPTWYSHLVLLDYAEHANLGWNGDKAEALKHDCTWLPVSLSEMAQASAHLPIVIMRCEQRWLIVVVTNDIFLSSIRGRNTEPLKHVFVPQSAQVYPFSLMLLEASKSGFQLGIDKRCIVPLEDTEALPLFSANRGYSEAVMDRFHLLHRLKIDSEIVHSACELLAKKGVLILISETEKIMGNNKERDRPIYRVDIDAIARLSREDFADLQMHHAMELAAYQHSSLFHAGCLNQDAN